MTSRPRSAARRPGLPVAQLDSALMPLGDRERGEPIAETEATRFKCSLERGLQLISGRSAVAASAAMRRSRRSGGDGCSCESCLQRAGGSSQSRAPRFRAFPGLSLAGARCSCGDRSRARALWGGRQAMRTPPGWSGRGRGHARGGPRAATNETTRPPVASRLRARTGPSCANTRMHVLSTKQLEHGGVAVSRCRDPRTAPSRECTRIRSDTTVEVDAAARWRDQLAVIARARARHVPGARHRRPTITAITTHRTQPATLSPPPLTVVWPPTALTVTPPCSSESPPQ